MLINVKMPTIVGIVTFISMNIQHMRILNQEKSLFLTILVFMKDGNFMLS